MGSEASQTPTSPLVSVRPSVWIPLPLPRQGLGSGVSSGRRRRRVFPFPLIHRASCICPLLRLFVSPSPSPSPLRLLSLSLLSDLLWKQNPKRNLNSKRNPNRKRKRVTGPSAPPRGPCVGWGPHRPRREVRVRLERERSVRVIPPNPCPPNPRGRGPWVRRAHRVRMENVHAVRPAHDSATALVSILLVVVLLCILYPAPCIRAWNRNVPMSSANTAVYELRCACSSSRLSAFSCVLLARLLLVVC